MVGVKTRLDKLRDLEADLLELMGKANSRAYPALARQYRETLREIDEIEGGEDDDEIAAIILRHRKPAADQ